MIEMSEAIDKIAPALHAAQGAIRGYEKDRPNSHFKSKYATLESVIEAAKPALQANGLSFIQAPGAIVNGCLQISTLILHTSGQWLRSGAEVPLPKTDPQGMGSATTYGKRYSLCALLGLAEADDDGEAAAIHQPEPVKSKPDETGRNRVSLADIPDDMPITLPPPGTNLGPDPFDEPIAEAFRAKVDAAATGSEVTAYVTKADTQRALASLPAKLAEELREYGRARFFKLKKEIAA